MIEAKVASKPTSPGWTVQEYLRVAGFKQLVGHHHPITQASILAVHLQSPHGISSVTMTVIGFGGSSAAETRFIVIPDERLTNTMMRRYFFIT